MNLSAKSLRSCFLCAGFFLFTQRSKKSHKVLKRSSDGLGFMIRCVKKHSSKNAAGPSASVKGINPDQ